MKKVGIIGLGRFGRFWASILSQSYEVYGYNKTKPENLPCKFVSIEEICSLPVIFICVPMRFFESVLRQIADLLRPGTLIIDTCSVKIKPVRWMCEQLPANINILASHPMFGPDSAKEGLKGLPMMMYPVRVNNEIYLTWLNFFKSLGIMIVEMTPEEHDMQAAKSQALTHMIGKTLNTLGINETPIGTLWYRKLLAICKQVAKDSPELFIDMQTLNPYADSVRKDFEKAWQQVCKSLTDGANHG